jgi:hypothetical protein
MQELARDSAGRGNAAQTHTIATGIRSGATRRSRRDGTSMGGTQDMIELTDEERQEALDLAADWADISQGLRKDLGQQLAQPVDQADPARAASARKPARSTCSCPPNFPPTGWPTALPTASLAWKIARSEVRHVRISVHPGRRHRPNCALAERRNRRRSRQHGAHGDRDGRFTEELGCSDRARRARSVADLCHVRVRLGQRAGLATPRSAWRRPKRRNSRRSTSRPRPGRARRTCSTRSATPILPPPSGRASSIARPSASWSNSSRRCARTR